MRCNHFAAVLAGLAAIALLAADASAMYHPTLGRFLQRDPIGYADGMGLYQYVGSRPLRASDPTGALSASYAGAYPKHEACRSAWWGVWITPDGESTPGVLVVSWAQSWVVWDCQGGQLDSGSRTKYYYLPVDAAGKAGYMAGPGGLHFSGEAIVNGEPTAPFFHVVLWENQRTGRGGKFRGDCTWGMLNVETRVQYHSLLNPGTEQTVWQGSRFAPIPKDYTHPDPNPSNLEYDPQGPGAYRSDDPPLGMDRGPPSGSLVFQFFYGWSCCGRRPDFAATWKPLDLPMGENRPGRKLAPELDRSEELMPVEW